MVPTVGRIVHYIDRGGPKRAAIIVHVHDDTHVNLACFDGAGNRFGIKNAAHGSAEGQWDWPVIQKFDKEKEPAPAGQEEAKPKRGRRKQ